MQKLYLAGAAALLVIGISSTVAYNYRYHLYDLLPSTDESELTNTDGLIYDKNGKLFTGRVKDSTDTGYSIYSYKDGELDASMSCLARVNSVKLAIGCMVSKMACLNHGIKKASS